jgi:hypothetical protein
MLKYTSIGLFVVGVVACGGDATPAGTPPDAGLSPSPSPTPGTAGLHASASGRTTSEAENNDDFATAQPVEVGETIQVRWEKPEDQDYFSVTIPPGPADGYLEVTLEESDPNATPRLELYRGDRSRVQTASARDATTNPFSFRKNVTAGKQYFVSLGDAAGSRDAIIPYSVTFTFVPVADLFERNDDFDVAKSITPGTPFDLVLFAGIDTNDADDADFFSLTVPPDKTKLHVEITNKSTSNEPQAHFVTLFSASKSRTGSASEPNSRADLSADFNIKSGEKAYLKFYDGGRQGSATASRVTVTLL